MRAECFEELRELVEAPPKLNTTWMPLPPVKPLAPLEASSSEPTWEDLEAAELQAQDALGQEADAAAVQAEADPTHADGDKERSDCCLLPETAAASASAEPELSDDLPSFDL
jgi:hypothetical protein